MPLRMTSVVKEELSKYRDIKIASGIKAVSIDRYISYIDDFYNKYNIQEITFTKDMTVLWHRKRNEQEGRFVKYVRTIYLIEFLSYLTSQNYNVYIPHRIPYKPSKFIAKIFTEEELVKYFEFIDQFENSRDPMTSLYVPIVFRILICCGTRVGETLALRVEDVNLKEGIIHLKMTKNGKFRSIPVSDSLLKVLRQYATKCLYLKNNKDFFFSHIDGRKVKENSIYLIHRQALSYAGIPYVGSTEGPRLHDLRHTFAVNSLKQFESRGCDLNNVLPILKNYLGHTNISATEKYLQLVSQNFDDVLNKTKETERIIMGENNDK